MASRRRITIAIVAVAYAVALAVTIVVTTAGSDAPDPADEIATTARSIEAPPPSASPAPPAPVVPPSEPAEPEPEERPRRKRKARPLPRVAASSDPPAKDEPGPAPPEAGEALLGACCSEPRGTAPVDTIVIHTTDSPDRPGTRDLDLLQRFLAGVKLAAHVGNDAEGNSLRMVPDDQIAYHATYWNATSVGIEQVGYPHYTRKQWLEQRAAQLDSTARWIAYWARRYRIPIRRCEVAGLRYNRRKRVVAGEVVRRGVCSHAELDPENRTDPGGSYPWDVVLAKARTIASAG